ncbi:MAG: TetR family transcriptional regulator [Nocardioides sp.]|uniref:TetR/AcrR family transcriptional regulator n=1 Tax=Nocardioides sp. TaxID=35761 RepID=UPI0039E35135
MARPKKQQQRRADLVRAAARAIAVRGVAGLTVRDVAAQAEMSPGAVSYYYRELDELVLAVHADAVRRFYGVRREAIDAIDDPAEQLAELVRLGVPTGADDLVCRVLYELHVHGARSAPHAALMSSLWEQEVSLYELVLTRGVERGTFGLRGTPRRVAETVVALEDAVGLHVVGHNPGVTPARALELVAGLVELEVGRAGVPS